MRSNPVSISVVEAGETEEAEEYRRQQKVPGEQRRRIVQSRERLLQLLELETHDETGKVRKQSHLPRFTEEERTIIGDAFMCAIHDEALNVPSSASGDLKAGSGMQRRRASVAAAAAAMPPRPDAGGSVAPNGASARAGANVCTAETRTNGKASRKKREQASSSSSKYAAADSSNDDDLVADSCERKPSLSSSKSTISSTVTADGPTRYAKVSGHGAALGAAHQRANEVVAEHAWKDEKFIQEFEAEERWHNELKNAAINRSVFRRLTIFLFDSKETYFADQLFEFVVLRVRAYNRHLRKEGLLGFEEIVLGLRVFKSAEEDVRAAAIICVYDVNLDGLLSRKEALSACNQCHGGHTEADLLAFLRHIEKERKAVVRTAQRAGGGGGTFHDLVFDDYLQHVRSDGENGAVKQFRQRVLL